MQSLSTTQFVRTLADRAAFCVMFTAAWCGPCQTIKKRISATPAATFRSVPIYTVDVDAEGGLADQYGVESLPTFVFFQRGRAVSSVVGADFDALVKVCSSF